MSRLTNKQIRANTLSNRTLKQLFEIITDDRTAALAMFYVGDYPIIARICIFYAHFIVHSFSVAFLLPVCFVSELFTAFSQTHIQPLGALYSDTNT